MDRHCPFSQQFVSDCLLTPGLQRLFVALFLTTTCTRPVPCLSLFSKQALLSLERSQGCNSTLHSACVQYPAGNWLTRCFESLSGTQMSTIPASEKQGSGLQRCNRPKGHRPISWGMMFKTMTNKSKSSMMGSE